MISYYRNGLVFFFRFTSDLMRAVCIKEFGPPDVLKIKEIVKPSPGKTEVIISCSFFVR